MFQLHAVSRSFGEVQALREIDLEIRAGQTTALIGPSGCGKSTLLRILLGLVAPSAGQVRFDDQEVTAASAPALRRGMGYVIQGGGLFPHLDASRNVELLPRHLGWAKERIRSRRLELGALASIDPALWDRYPSEISGGQSQRIALVRALMTNPGVLLLDEPLGSLDPLVRADLQQELRAIFQTLNKTVVLVTHDLAEAAYLADRIILLRAGSIEQSGSFAEMSDRPASLFVERFLRAHAGPLQA